VGELVAYAKAQPGKLSFGVPNAAPPHMLAAWFKALTGTDIVIVPYKGASAVLTDMLAGQIQAGFETTSVLFGHLQEKKIRALAVATRQRLPDLPDVPTMIESGFPDFIASSWTTSWRRPERRRTSLASSMPRSMPGWAPRKCRRGSSSSRRGAARNAGRARGLRRRRDSKMAGAGQAHRRHRRMSSRTASCVIPKKPAPDLIRVGTGFRKRSRAK
jgi:hypothetical protein